MTESSTSEKMARRVRVARGEEPGDIVLTGGRVVNVFTQSIEEANVVVADGWIAGVGRFDWAAAETIDVGGGLLGPGLVDAHVHIESTLLMPPQFARVVVPRGTTTVIADPHEIGNVLGAEGIELMLDASRDLPLDCYFMAPSCVPASAFEHPGSTLGAEEIAALLGHDRVLGLGEMMNFPGVLGGDPEVMAKIHATNAEGGAVDGHAPGVAGRDLIAYAAAGIRSDHECTTAEEARQRSALGMLVQIREGSMARNLEALLPLVVAGELDAWCICTDDMHPEDLVRDGHLDPILRRLVAAGVPVAHAMRHAALVPARHYGLVDRGAVAPGYRADLVIWKSATVLEATLVMKDGRVVARDGVLDVAPKGSGVVAKNTIDFAPLTPSDFDYDVPAGEIAVIGVIPDQIVTRHERASLTAGRWMFDPNEDLALIACVERHRASGDRGLGLVRGFGFKSHGAIGSSVGHDAHNLMLAGTRGQDMVVCAEALCEMGGGFVVVNDGEVTARLPLPVAGLMSDEPVEDVCAGQAEVDRAAHTLGCRLHSPFGTLSFLGLSVIPSLRMTDRGMFDVERFALVTESS